VAEKVQSIEAEGVTDRADLIDEGVHDPQRGVVRMVSDLPQPSWS
jgi:hypothetical protein